MAVASKRSVSEYTHTSDFTPERKDKIRKLRDSLSDVLDEIPEDDDYFYIRWLMARGHSIPKAEKMLRNHIKFRKEFNVDQVLDWTPPEVLQKCFPGGFFGEDREGDPVWYDNFGNLDFKGIYRSCRREDIIRLKIYHLELTTRVLQEASQKKGRRVFQVTSVIDVENLSYQKHYHWPSIQTFREILTMFEDNYPARTKRIILVNAPQVFPVAYNLLKPFIDEGTRKKIIVLGTQLEEVQTYISPDQLPQAYGGTRCEPDPYCTDHINPGCDVPENYYLTNQTETSREEMERVVVRRGSSHEVEYQVDTAGTVLRWEFVTTNHDIGFGLFRKSEKKKEDHVEVMSMKRRNSHVIPENGFYNCERDGTYVMKFDNSYSWTRAKEVFYSVKMLPPDTELGGPNEATPPHETTPTQTSSNANTEEVCQSSELAGGTSSTGITTQQQEMRTGLTTVAEVDPTSQEPVSTSVS